MNKKKKMIICFVLGMVGCLCFGGGDWLMIYGNTAHTGELYWLTQGIIGISPARNTIAMALAFPGIICYGTGLFAMAGFIKDSRDRKIYRVLNIFGLTPWLCLHIFYILLLAIYAYMGSNGYQGADEICHAVYSSLSWIIPLSEAFMLPPFIYYMYLQLRGKTYFSRLGGFFGANVLVNYGVLYVVSLIMPDVPARLGFKNGLMSESMIILFAVLVICTVKNIHGVADEEKFTLIP